MKERILHVLDKISIESGVSSVVMNYYAKLDHDSITFDFMLNEEPDEKTAAYIKSNGSNIYIMPALKAANTFKYIKALKQFYKNCEYKIIHGHVANSAIFYLGLARKKIPIRIIHSHSTKSADIWWKRIRNWLLTRSIKHTANRYMACSDEAAKFLFGKNNKAVILHNAINIEKFLFDLEKRENIRRELAIEDKLVIGHVGRFTPLKNHGFLLDIFHEVQKKNRETALLLIGGGELYGAIEKKAKNLGLDGEVLFLGAKENVADYMSAMDIFVLPSHFEGLGLVGVEAQAAGLPVLAAENVPRSMDITGETTFIPLDSALWTNELLKEGPHDRISSGYQVKGSCFDINTQVKKLCDFYKGL